MDKVIRGSVRLNARAVGERSGRPDLLLIHGLNANMAFWHPAITRALSADRLLVMYDQRGHGRSDLPASGYTSSELARDAVSVLDAYGVDRADIVAHSFGCTVALQLARLFPDRAGSLVLMDARLRVFQPTVKLGDWPDFVRWKASLGEAGERLDPELALDFMIPLYLASDLRPAGGDLVANGFSPMGGGKRSADRYRRLLEETSAIKDYQDLDGLDAEALRLLRNRVLAVYGSRSPFLDTLAAMQRELQRCETGLIDEGGHNFPVLFPEQTSARILGFLEGEAVPALAVPERIA